MLAMFIDSLENTSLPTLSNIITSGEALGGALQERTQLLVLYKFTGIFMGQRSSN